MIVAGITDILHPIENVLRHILDWLHGTVGLPWAWAIVALTLLVRLLIVPLSVRQIHSMVALQKYAPMMKEIQQKYKNDKPKQQEELMRFYREHKINPAAACLPIIPQIPIFFSLYYVLRHLASEAEKTPERFGNLEWLGLFNITEKASHGWGPALLVVYVASQLFASYYMSTTADKTQRILLMVLPVVFVSFITRFPQGLVIYWVTTNLWTVGQGLITRRLIPKPPPPQKKSSRTPPKDSGDGSGPAQGDRGGRRDGGSPAKPKPEPTGTPPAGQQPPRRVKRKKKSGRR